MKLEELQNAWIGARFTREEFHGTTAERDFGFIKDIAVLHGFLCVQVRTDVDDGFAFILVKMPLENDKLEDVCAKMNAKLVDMCSEAATVCYGKHVMAVTIQSIIVHRPPDASEPQRVFTYLDTPAAATEEPAPHTPINTTGFIDTEFLDAVDNAWSALMDLDIVNYVVAHGVDHDIAAAQLDKINDERNNIPVLTVVMTAIVATMSERHVETFDEWMLSVGDNNLRAAWRRYNVTEYMPDLLKTVRAHEQAAPEVPMPLEDYYEIVKTFVRLHGWT